MTKHTYILGASLAATLLMAGCADQGIFNGPMSDMDPEAAYPITVGPHMESMAYAGPASNDQLAGFAGNFMASGNGSITVSASNPDAAKNVAGRLVSLGVPRDRIVVGAPSQGANVQLSFVGYGATSPVCGHWEENIASTFYNQPTPNFGCATQHNIAAQIADPRDLVTPQAMTPPDTERRMIVIDHWRKGEPTSSTKTDEQSGAVSEVAH